MKKIAFTFFFITILLSFAMMIFQKPLLANTETTKDEIRDIYLNILTVNKPQADMVKKIIKDKHNVQYMVTELKDIDSFDYDDDTINNASKMDLFIYSGVNFEPWIDKFISRLRKKNLGIINLSRGVRLLNYDKETKENPYYFEGIDEYRIALYNVKNSIQDKDPKNRDYYEKNYEKAIKEFNDKVKENEKQIEFMRQYTFITLDNRFDYILKSLNLNYMNLNDEYLNKFIEDNNLDVEKLIIIQDGDDLIDLQTLINDEIEEMKEIPIENTNEKINEYKTIELWKYYGNMSFDELILYNINEISKFADNEIIDSANLSTIEEDKQE